MNPVEEAYYDSKNSKFLGASKLPEFIDGKILRKMWIYFRSKNERCQKLFPFTQIDLYDTELSDILAFISNPQNTLISIEYQYIEKYFLQFIEICDRIKEANIRFYFTDGSDGLFIIYSDTEKSFVIRILQIQDTKFLREIREKCLGGSNERYCITVLYY